MRRGIEHDCDAQGNGAFGPVEDPRAGWDILADIGRRMVTERVR